MVQNLQRSTAIQGTLLNLIILHGDDVSIVYIILSSSTPNMLVCLKL